MVGGYVYFDSRLFSEIINAGTYPATVPGVFAEAERVHKAGKLVIAPSVVKGSHDSAPSSLGLSKVSVDGGYIYGVITQDGSKFTIADNDMVASIT